MATLKISLDTLSAILEHRRQGDDEIEDILQRLAAKNVDGAEGGWSHSGVVLREGTPLRFSYMDQLFKGSIRDGLLEFQGIQEESPSKAAILTIESETGKKISLNGWTAISAQVASQRGHEWIKLADLRRAAQEGAARIVRE